MQYLFFAGCDVFAYDHNATEAVVEEGRRLAGLEVHRKFLDGAEVSDTKTTIENELRNHGHLGDTITYLKARLEGPFTHCYKTT